MGYNQWDFKESDTGEHVYINRICLFAIACHNLLKNIKSDFKILLTNSFYYFNRIRCEQEIKYLILYLILHWDLWLVVGSKNCYNVNSYYSCIRYIFFLAQMKQCKRTVATGLSHESGSYPPHEYYHEASEVIG